MTRPPSLRHLEDTYLFPVLNARVAPRSRRRCARLEALQCRVIGAMRTVFYPCTSDASLHHALALSLTAPSLRRMWEDMHTLGFPSLLDQTAAHPHVPQALSA